MSLAARCPACGTTFRVHTAQLAAKGGKVRCGKCAAVFNGVSALLEGEAAAPAESALEEPSAEATAAPDGGLLRPARRSQHGFAWGVAALLAALALAGQAVLHNRTEMALLWPWAQPHLAATCDLLGCQLRLPHRPDLLSIESSDIQSDHARERLIVLNAVVRNRAPFAQEYPALELTLTDERDYAVLRRVLLPADYLRAPPAAGRAQGIAGGAEAVLRMHLENRGPHAVGYRLYLFFP